MSYLAIEIEYKGITFDVEYEYQPYERPDRGIEAQYPGCAECVECVTSMIHKGTDFVEFYELDEDGIDEIILDKMAKNREL